MKGLDPRAARRAALLGVAIGALLLGAAGCAEVPARDAYGGLLRWRAPAGMAVAKSSIFSEPDALEIVDERRRGVRIEVELLDGDPAKSERVQGLMRAPWDADFPSPAREAGRLRVAGVETTLWRRESSPKYVEEPGQAKRYYLDEFCTVPAGGRFFLIALSVAGGTPVLLDDDVRGEWRTFLASLEIKTAAR
jgi:hypothetical protein